MKTDIFIILMVFGTLYFLNHPNATFDSFIQDVVEQIDTLQKQATKSNAVSPSLPRPPKLARNNNIIRSYKTQSTHVYHQDDLAELVKACNATNATVRDLAVTIASQSPGSYNIGQVCDIFDYVNQHWKYVNDPSIGGDYVAKASQTIANNFVGDCDDHAVIMGSFIIAIGGTAQISYAYNSESGHAFTEILLHENDRQAVKIYLANRYGKQAIRGIRRDATGLYWLNLDWMEAFPGGKYFNWDRGYTFNISDRIVTSLSVP